MTKLNPVTRSTSVAEWFERQEQNKARHEEGIRHGLAYQPQPTDVFISPHGKCGTTWLQQIVHGLKTRGDMDFDDISRVVPWLEWAYEQGLDIYAPQKGAFRAFKSHLSWHDIPKGGCYLVSVRDPKDALVSIYHFFDNFEFEAGSISISEFAREFYMADRPLGRYWQHLASWWERRHDQNVLLLCFEEMKTDLTGTVQAIARFIDVELDEALLEIVVRQSSFDFMLAHKDKFDENLMRDFFVKTGMHPPGRCGKGEKRPCWRSPERTAGGHQRRDGRHLARQDRGQIRPGVLPNPARNAYPRGSLMNHVLVRAKRVEVGNCGARSAAINAN